MVFTHSEQLHQIEELLNEMNGNIRIVVTGSRGWSNKLAILKAVDAVTSTGLVTEAMHGNAKGADKMFAQACHRYGVPQVTAVPAQWDKHDEECPEWHLELKQCKRAGWRRNFEMAEMMPDICLAFRVNNSRGTQSMIDLCSQRDIPVVLFSE